jgi:hypothetical protein
MQQLKINLKNKKNILIFFKKYIFLKVTITTIKCILSLE